MAEYRAQRLGEEDYTEDIRRRIWVLILFVGVLFAILALRLWYLQIVKGEHFRELSESNRIRVVDLMPPRGILYDRNGIPLADNVPSHVVTFTPEDAEGHKGVREKLAAILGITGEELTARIKRARHRAPLQPIRVMENASFQTVSIIEARKDELPGVMLQHELRRNYPYGTLAAHVLGYIGGITQAESEKEEYRDLPGDMPIGKYGLEYAYDGLIRGKPGSRGIEVDAMGRRLRTLFEVEPEPGTDLELTLDYYAQKAADEALEGQWGAIVAIDPNTGELLAMSSSPGFDPNDFALGISAEKWKDLTGNEAHPLNNRATQGAFPPGSTFKLAMALGGLQSGNIRPGDTCDCTGGWRFGGRTFRCWKRSGHGRISMHRAIVESCDVYFYKLGDRMGIDTIAEYAGLLGLGKRTDIVLRESPGLIPTTGWKERVYGRPWFPGETLSCSIGQGSVLVTPLQLARMASTIVNGGTLYRPQLLKAIQFTDRRSWVPMMPTVLERPQFDKKNLDVVINGMYGVVNENGGTAHRAHIDGVTVGGKTGTAQVVSLGITEQSKDEKKFQDHAWFVAAAPMEAPEIAVAVLVEHGGHGGSAAAPLAKQVIEAYLLGHGKAPEEQDSVKDDG